MTHADYVNLMAVLRRIDGNVKPSMTHREYFSALMAQGFISTNPHYDGTFAPQKVAELAVEHADALIEALNK